jgi:dipeptidyl aminopeptidase/acylaminoacyl peptidase
MSGRPVYEDVSKSITNFEISPDGKRAIFGSHGEVFTVPEKYGETRNLTQSSGIHERDSKWSADGKWISYISDKTGEDEIFIQAQDGSPQWRSHPEVQTINISHTGHPIAKNFSGPIEIKSCIMSISIQN